LIENLLQSQNGRCYQSSLSSRTTATYLDLSYGCMSGHRVCYTRPTTWSISGTFVNARNIAPALCISAMASLFLISGNAFSSTPVLIQRQPLTAIESFVVKGTPRKWLRMYERLSSTGPLPSSSCWTRMSTCWPLLTHWQSYSWIYGIDMGLDCNAPIDKGFDDILTP